LWHDVIDDIFVSVRSSNPKPPFLSLRNASFRLGDRLVFEDTTWTFRRGEHWAVIGANGSGKSLFADALRGKLPLVAGELHYHFSPPPGASPEQAVGHVSFDDRKHETHGAVVQSRWNSLEADSALRVSDFLSYERVMEINPYEISEIRTHSRLGFERRRRKAVVLLRLTPFLDRRLLSLSNGETQRVQLARGLCHPLRLLILDEPFLGLDTANRLYFQNVLARLMATSLRVLLVTTRPEDLPREMTHILRVEDCRLAAAGPRGQFRDNLIQHPSGSSSALPLPARTKRKGTSGRRRGPRELVSLLNVTVRYGSAVILHEINWTVREGESWALLGPNGSGKTTLLSLLQGDNPQAYRNHVRVFGKQRGSGESIWALKRRIGSVSPELHLYFDDRATCFDVVASGFNETIGLFETPTRRQRAAAGQWLERFGLSENASLPLFALSSGLQRLVLLARALVKSPALLLLDEPCQGLDEAHRRQFVQMVNDLIAARSVTAIYVTHREDEIPRAISRVLCLSAGLTTLLRR
jgi:molybdate transport system ATP-binding protein